MHYLVIEMSDENKPSQGEDKEKIEERNIKIEVDRSKIEKEQQERITELEKEKSRIASELDKMNKKLKELEEANKTKTEEYEKIITERDRYRDELTDIALEKFEEEKKKLFDKIKEEGVLPEEKIQELDAEIEGPNDLTKIVRTYEFLKETFDTAKKQREEAEAQKKKEEKEKKEKVSVEKPPEGSQVPLEEPGKPKAYNTEREMIDDLYARVAKGDKVAEKQLRQIWQKAVVTMKKTIGKRMAIIECPRCGNGILEGEICPFCGWDPSKSRLVVF